MVYVLHLCDPYFCKTYIIYLLRVITLQYSGRVEADVFELRLGLGGARQVASQPAAKITIDLEPCMTMLLEKLRKSDRSLGDCCLCLQHMFKDQPWLLRVSG